VKIIFQLLKLLAPLLFAAVSMSAANFSFTGSFTTDDQEQIFDLSLTSATTVTFETLSYGGGTNAAGTVIPSGGFDPRLTWFQSDGTEIGSNGGPYCGSNGSFLGACNDAYFQGTLAAGSYFLALTQDGNDPNGDLSAGFSEQGNPNFTANGLCNQFCDSLSGNELAGTWAVDILGVNSANPATVVPEPATISLTGIGLSLLSLASRKRRA